MEKFDGTICDQNLTQLLVQYLSNREPYHVAFFTLLDKYMYNVNQICTCLYYASKMHLLAHKLSTSIEEKAAIVLNYVRCSETQVDPKCCTNTKGENGRNL